MASITSQIVVVVVNREIRSEKSNQEAKPTIMSSNETDLFVAISTHCLSEEKNCTLLHALSYPVNRPLPTERKNNMK